MTIITVKTGGIAADAVTDAKIADDVVGTEHLTANEVDTAALKGDAVTGAELADNAVNSEHYTDGSIDTAHLADGQVTIGKLATAVLTGATDIGAAIVDADLFLVDDGAGGTLRKTAASRLKTYVGGVNTPVFRAYRNATQALANGADVTIVFNAEDYDPQSTYNTSNGKFIPAVAGKYFLFTKLQFAGASDQGQFELYIKKNSGIVAAYRHNPSGTGAFSIQLSDIVVADTDDEFTVLLYQNSGGSINASAGSTTTFFTGFKLIE